MKDEYLYFSQNPSAAVEGKLSASPSVQWRLQGEEALLMPVESGEYFVLKGSSVFLWEQLTEGSFTAEELVAALLEEFEVEEAEARLEVQNFCHFLFREKLVELG